MPSGVVSSLNLILILSGVVALSSLELPALSVTFAVIDVPSFVALSLTTTLPLCGSSVKSVAGAVVLPGVLSTTQPALGFLITVIVCELPLLSVYEISTLDASPSCETTLTVPSGFGVSSA